MMSEASVSIRLNPFKTPEGGFELPQGAQRVPWSPYGYMLSERPSFTLDPLFHAGCYYVQDSSAMYVGHIFRKVLASRFAGARGLRVLDLCAAPGGKSTDISVSLREACGDDFLLVSNEVMKQRAGVLQDNIMRWGDPRVTVTSCDPAAFSRLEGFFDIIVADVPCSGEGMFRKDPRAREEWSPEVVKLCAARQKRILADVWPALREGGVLVYSTCTYEECENDENLEWAASELGGEIIVPENEYADCGVVQTRVGNLLEVGKVPGEGQWVGALVKTSASGSCRGSLQSAVRPFRQKEEGFDPDAPLSLDFDRSSCNCADVDKALALKYLHRDSIVLKDAPLGYNVITYKGVALGYVKNIGNRCNNLLPKSRRILMNV